MFHIFYRIFSLLIVAFLLFGVVISTLEILESGNKLERLTEIFWFPVLFLAVAGLISRYIFVTWKLDKDQATSSGLIDAPQERSIRAYLPSRIGFTLLSILQVLIGLSCMAMFIILLRNVARMEQLTIYNALPLTMNSLMVIYGMLTQVFVIRMLIRFRRKRRALNL